MDVLQRQASAEPAQTSQLQLLEGLLTPSPRVMGRSHSAAAPSETAAMAAAGGPATSSGAVDAWAVVETKKMKQQRAKARRLQAVHLWAARIQVAAAATRIQAVVRGRRTRARLPLEPEPEPVEPEPPVPLGAVGTFEVLEAAPSDHHYLGEPAPAGKESKQLMRRAAEEWQMMQNGLPEGATVQVFEDRMDLLRCFVEGPTGTPYEGGLFILDLRLPAQYPAASPKAFYWAFGRYCNPNLYACGKVCLSLLGTWQGPGWTPESTLLQLIVSVQGLVLIEHPYCNEPGQERDAGSEHSVAYNMQTQADVAANMTQMCTTPPEGAAHIVAAFAARQGAALVARARDYANDRLGDSALASLDSAFGHPLGRPVFFKPGSAEADRSLLSFYRVTARDHHCEAEAEPRLVEHYRAAAATPDWLRVYNEPFTSGYAKEEGEEDDY